MGRKLIVTLVTGTETKKNLIKNNSNNNNTIAITINIIINKDTTIKNNTKIDG